MKIIVFVLNAVAAFLIGTSIKLSIVSAVTLPIAFPGNAIVKVSPGSGTITVAVAAHGSNTTYMLSSGNYTKEHVNIPDGAQNIQFIGQGSAETIVKAADNSTAFRSNGSLKAVQVWNMTIDCNTDGSAWFGQGDYILLKNLLVKNYASTVRGKEDFIVFAFAGGNHTQTNFVVDSCRFTPSSSGNVDGTTVINLGAFRPDGSNYSRNNVTNCTFDTPTDTGTLYYHCVTSANLVSGCTFTAPSFSSGQFYFVEPGSWNGSRAFQDDSSSSCTLTNNTVHLESNWSFARDQTHSNGRLGIWNIIGNTISNGIVFQLGYGDGYPPNPSIVSVTIQHNILTSCTLADLDGSPDGAVGTMTISPNSTTKTVINESTRHPHKPSFWSWINAFL